MAPKPSQIASWNTGGTNNIEPSAGKKITGWVNGEAVPSGWLNWFMKLVGEWTAYVDDGFFADMLADILATANTWTKKQTFSTTTLNADAVSATGNGTGAGVRGTGGTGAGGAPGVVGIGGNGGMGVLGIADADGDGVVGLVAPSYQGAGVRGSAGSGSPTSAGGVFEGGTEGYGLVCSGNSTRPALLIVPFPGNPSAPDNGSIWYDSSAHALKIRINGVTRTVTVT